GSVLASATPALPPPRNCVQLSSAVAPAARTRVSVKESGPLRSMVGPLLTGGADGRTPGHDTDSAGPRLSSGRFAFCCGGAELPLAARLPGWYTVQVFGLHCI